MHEAAGFGRAFAENAAGSLPDELETSSKNQREC
jgi:hypothetical protein